MIKERYPKKKLQMLLVININNPSKLGLKQSFHHQWNLSGE